MDDVTSIFDRYEEVRHRLPQVGLSAGTTEIASLLDIVGEADAFAFDAFGVLNVGEIPIEGAAERLNQLRARGRQIRILTNSASYDRATTVEKFRGLGLQVTLDEIHTSIEIGRAEGRERGGSQG